MRVKFFKDVTAISLSSQYNMKELCIWIIFHAEYRLDTLMGLGVETKYATLKAK